MFLAAWNIQTCGNAMPRGKGIINSLRETIIVAKHSSNSYEIISKQKGTDRTVIRSAPVNLHQKVLQSESVNSLNVMAGPRREL